MFYVLYNPGIEKKNIFKKINKSLKKCKLGTDYYKISIFDINGKEESFALSIKDEDIVMLVGGDGTIDQFLNRIMNVKMKGRLFIYPAGSGNDLAREFKDRPFEFTEYIPILPKLTINDNEKSVLFNGVGMGVDAIVCRSKNQYKIAGVKKGYFSIALSSFKKFRPYTLNIELDGKEMKFENVWFFVANCGKYMGGGMKVCPNVSRFDEDLEICIVDNVGIFKLILIFPSIYFGLHHIFKKNVHLFRAKKVMVKPEGCSVLQRDGEVLEYVHHMTIEK